MLTRFLPMAALALVMMVPAAWAQEASRIGICNPGKVFDGLDERKAMEQQMMNDRDQRQKEVNRRQEEIKLIERSLGNLRPGSPQHTEKQRELRQKAFELNVFGQMAQNDFAQAEKESVRALYRKMQDAVKEIAEEKKLDAVLAERRPEIPADISGLTKDQLRALITQHDVLYSNGKLDITEDVKTRMNQKYIAGGAGTGEPN